MSFIESGAELLERTESSLIALIADAAKAKSYKEVATLAAMAEAVAAIGPGRGTRAAAAEIGVNPAGVDRSKSFEPSWMRPKS
jgi:hypothetical protein